MHKGFLLFLLALPTAAQSFKHPGVLVSKSQLDFIKSRVASKTNPIYQEFLWAQASPYGAINYKALGPPSSGIIDCGPYSRPNHGCKAEDSDASAAYIQAILWYITGNHQYADNAIAILNVYGHNLKGYANSNAPLQAAWGASKWPRAAEIIRYSNAGWRPEDIQAFSQMLTTVNLPLIKDGSGSNGNWELSMIEATMGIAVFTDDRLLFDHAVKMWHERVPAYFFYDPIDHGKPVPPPRENQHLAWNGQTAFNGSLNGVTQETCRDLGHTEYGIAATMNAAEAAYFQGEKLYESEAPRLAAAMEFNSFLESGVPIPTDLCTGKKNTVNLNHLHATYVIGCNALHNRLGMPLPHTLNFIQQDVLINHFPDDGGHMQIFEPLTHADKIK